jgi:hypothetical protein
MRSNSQLVDLLFEPTCSPFDYQMYVLQKYETAVLVRVLKGFLSRRLLALSERDQCKLAGFKSDVVLPAESLDCFHWIGTTRKNKENGDIRT